MRSEERTALQKEIELVFSKYGTDNPGVEFEMSADEFKTVRDIALHVVRGNIDQQEISGLNSRLRANLDIMIKYLLSLKSKPGMRSLEERNPYYSAFSSAIIRDGYNEGGK